MGTPVIKRFDDNLTLGSIDSLALVYFPAKSPSAEEIAATKAHLHEVAQRSADGFGFILLVPPEGGPPEGKARDQANEMFRSIKGRVKLFAGILEGEGFAAAAKRGVLTLIVNFGFDKTAVKVFSNVSTACEWTVQQARATAVKAPPVSELQVCLEQMRRGKVG